MGTRRKEHAMNPRFQAVLKGETTNTPPVWMMRQAGRYHAHYQNLRKSHSFSDLCKKPKLAAEVALGPVADFDFDLAILFSDLLFPLEMLGMGLSYDKGGPELSESLDLAIIKRFRSVDQAVAGMEFQREAMAETRKILPNDKSLIGFVGGPWTLFVYAVEGTHKGNLIETKKRAPEIYAAFCESMVPLLRRNIQLQLDGGAEAVMILDTAAGELAPAEFRAWTLGPLAEIMQGFEGRVGYYAKGSTDDIFPLLKNKLTKDGRRCPFGIGLDHRFDLTKVLDRQDFAFVQGNFDQILLHQPRAEFEKNLRQYLSRFQSMTPQQRRGWICGVGHGLVPHTPEENVRAFVKIVREVIA